MTRKLLLNTRMIWMILMNSTDEYNLNKKRKTFIVLNDKDW